MSTGKTENDIHMIYETRSAFQHKLNEGFLNKNICKYHKLNYEKHIKACIKLEIHSIVILFYNILCFALRFLQQKTQEAYAYLDENMIGVACIFFSNVKRKEVFIEFVVGGSRCQDECWIDDHLVKYLFQLIEINWNKKWINERALL